MTGEGRERLAKHFERADAEEAAQEKRETEEQEAVRDFLEDARSRCLGTVKPAIEEAAALFTGPNRDAAVDVRESEHAFAIALEGAIDGRVSRLTFAANTDTRNIEVSRNIYALTGEHVGAYSTGELTGDVVQKHVNDLLGVLVQRMLGPLPSPIIQSR